MKKDRGERSRTCTHTDEGTDFDVSCISSTGQESVLCQIQVERGRPQVWASNLSIANVTRRQFIADSQLPLGATGIVPFAVFPAWSSMDRNGFGPHGHTAWPTSELGGDDDKFWRRQVPHALSWRQVIRRWCQGTSLA